MEAVGEKDRARVHVEDLTHPIVRVVVEVFVDPVEGVVVGLAHAAEVAGDGLRPAQMHIGAVGPLGVEGLHIGGPHDVHGRTHGQDVVVFDLLLHHPDPDVAGGHELALVDGLPRLGHEEGEVLEGAHFEGHGKVIFERYGPGTVAEDLGFVVGHGDEGLPVPLLHEPLEVLDIGRFQLLEPRHLVLQAPGLLRLGVDLFDGSIFTDDVEKGVDHFIRFGR